MINSKYFKLIIVQKINTKYRRCIDIEIKKVYNFRN